MGIYMKFGNVKGPVTTDGLKGWIEIESFRWETNRAITTAARGSSSREHSEPEIREITVTKLTDIASAQLFRESLAGLLNHTVEIKFTTTTKGKVETYLIYKLENTGISTFTVSGNGGGGGMPAESISLNFTKVTYSFTGYDPAITGTPEIVGYDLIQMKSM